MSAQVINWLASYPKSGNTWVRALLEAYRHNGIIDINAMSATTGDTQTFFYQVVSPIRYDHLKDIGMMLIRPAALLAQITGSSLRPLIVKTHCANIIPEGLPPLIPPILTKKVIYVMRDPRDVCLSVSKYFDKTFPEAREFMNNSQAQIGQEMTVSSLISSWSIHVKSFVEEQAFPVLFVKYEDLMREPEAELVRILDFVEIPVEVDRVSKAVKAANLSRLRHQEEKSGFREHHSSKAESFFGKGGSRWQEELPVNVTADIELDHCEMMEKLGYL